ncbi:MAG: hypothetical protein OSW77_07990 [Proteobacteria bacterium]|nr:hypothetical protein [Pseudomonadota bacterium]
MAKKLAGGLILGSLLATTGWAETSSPSVVVPPPSASVIATPPQPGWSALSTQQKAILAPLSA